ncbi:MAG TPA: glycosyltransferase family 9 protein [Gemmataceae bacterium]|nr:glycosyltransferase family 9 protein [Gemmataceae bacterium]
MQIRGRPRFLIVRLSSLGDVIQSVPVLNALRDHFPQAHISWVIRGRPADLLQGHKALDELIVLPTNWLLRPQEWWRLYCRLRELASNVCVDVQCLAKTSVVSLMSGARWRIGIDGRFGREFSRWINNSLVLPTKAHAVDQYLELLRPLGIKNPIARFDLPDFPAEAATVAVFLRQHGLEENFVLLNPGASWASKRWPPERFALVARYLRDSRRLRSVVLWAGQEEKTWAEEIVHKADSQAELAPPTNLRELASILRRSRLFVGSDTGPLHLAAAVDTPCVGLFGPMPADRCGPYGPQHIALQKVPPAGSHGMRRNASNETMCVITVDDVIAACDTVLSRQPSSPQKRCA